MSRDLDSNGMGGAFDEPSAEHSERAEAEWLLAREKNPAAPPPSAAVAREHEELETLLGSMPDGPSDQSWHDEVLKKAMAKPSEEESLGNGQILPLASPARRPWWKRAAALWATGGAATAIAAAAVLTLTVFSQGPTGTGTSGDGLMIATITEGGVRGETERPAALEIESAKGDLRIFRKASPTSTSYEVARCSAAGDRCKALGDKLAFRVTLEQPGLYQVVWAERTVANTDGGTLEAFERAASDQKIKVIRGKQIERR